MIWCYRLSEMSSLRFCERDALILYNNVWVQCEIGLKVSYVLQCNTYYWRRTPCPNFDDWNHEYFSRSRHTVSYETKRGTTSRSWRAAVVSVALQKRLLIFVSSWHYAWSTKTVTWPYILSTPFSSSLFEKFLTRLDITIPASCLCRPNLFFCIADAPCQKSSSVVPVLINPFLLERFSIK